MSQLVHRARVRARLTELEFLGEQYGQRQPIISDHVCIKAESSRRPILIVWSVGLVNANMVTVLLEFQK
jgi:hypothetical protein